MNNIEEWKLMEILRALPSVELLLGAKAREYVSLTDSCGNLFLNTNLPLSYGNKLWGNIKADLREEINKGLIKLVKIDLTFTENLEDKLYKDPESGEIKTNTDALDKAKDSIQAVVQELGSRIALLRKEFASNFLSYNQYMARKANSIPTSYKTPECYLNPIVY